MDYKWEAGQKVFSPSTGWSENPGDIRTIDRVTPSGRAVVGGFSYDKEGRRIGGGKWHSGRIEPATEEHYFEIKKWQKKSQCLLLFEKVNKRGLTDEQVQVLLPVLEKIVDEQK